MPANLKTLTVVQGTELTRALQAVDLVAGGPLGPSTYLPTDTLTGTIWLAQGEPAVVSFTPTWFNATLGQYVIFLTPAQTAALSIDTTYNVQVFVTRGAAGPFCIGWVYLSVYPAAGSQPSATPPDLSPGIDVLRLLAQLSLTEDQLEMVPTLISAASAGFRRACNDRDFTRTTYTKEFESELNGQIRLSQIPVNQILRVQGNRTTALTITADRSRLTSARVLSTITGDYATGITITGLTLISVANGTQTPTQIPFTAGMTVSDLAGLINAVSGWTATVGQGGPSDLGFGPWPVTELVGGLIAQGALGEDGVQLAVFADDLDDVWPDPDDGMATGIIWVGRPNQSGGMLGPRWGPGWQDFDDIGSAALHTRVRVTYDAGFAVIPADVKRAIADYVKAMLLRFKTDFYLRSESAGDYAYTLAEQVQGDMPPEVMQVAAKYRLMQA